VKGLFVFFFLAFGMSFSAASQSLDDYKKKVQKIRDKCDIQRPKYSPSISGPRDYSSVVSRIVQRQDLFSYFYEVARKEALQKGNLCYNGILRFEMVIDSSGNVSTTKKLFSSLNNTNLEEDAMGKVASLNFGEAKTSGNTIAEIQIEFVPFNLY